MKKYLTATVAVLAGVMIIGAGAEVFGFGGMGRGMMGSGWGSGYDSSTGYGPGMGMYGRGGGYGRRSGFGPGSGYGPGDCGRGYGSGLSEEAIANIERERTAFLKDTEPLKEKIYAKEAELQSELGKQDPDADRAVALQKELSELRAQLDQKRIEHRVAVRKMKP